MNANTRQLYVKKFNLDPNLPQPEIDQLIESNMKMAKAYLKAHGKLSSMFEMSLWWSVNRPSYNFNLKPEDLVWLNETVKNMSDTELENYAFPTPPTARTLYLISCLQDTKSRSGVWKQEDAFSYLMENCPLFASRLNELCD